MKKRVRLAVCFTGLLIAFLTPGCIETADIKGETHSGYKTIDRMCIDGIEYLHFRGEGYGSNFAPHFKPDGSLYKCN